MEIRINTVHRFPCPGTGEGLSSFLVPWSEPRMKRLLATLVILGLLFAGFVVFLPGQATAQTTRHGGWADSIVW